MDGEQILAELGLTDSEVRDYLRKLSGFYVSLTPKEREAFLSGMRAFERVALKEFHGEITAEQLEEFIRSREPKDVPVAPIFILHKCDGGDNDDH
ncbi:MAG: hypothetical protein ABSF64_36020 [Bryobacteraceae bacterium]